MATLVAATGVPATDSLAAAVAVALLPAAHQLIGAVVLATAVLDRDWTRVRSTTSSRAPRSTNKCSTRASAAAANATATALKGNTEKAPLLAFVGGFMALTFAQVIGAFVAASLWWRAKR